jgi:hypothetical protein
VSIEKAVLTNLDNDEKIEVLFNPKEYTLEKTAQWAQHRAPGGEAPEVQFLHGELRRLSMELFFDTTSDGTDVREHTDKMEGLIKIDPSLHRPPRLLFTWGSFNFECILVSLTQRFTMFYSSGKPCRAILSATFLENPGVRESEPMESSDHAKRRIVREGDTLNWIASQEYNDASKWRVIADANGIVDPADVRPGQTLLIPPLAH